MTSFDYRLNPIYAIKECSDCGVLYTADFCCSKKGLEDKILVSKPPRNCAKCARCGTPVDGPHCQGCALLRKKFKEDLFSYCVENEFLEDLQDTSESSDDNTNVVNAPREPIVVNQDPVENSSPSPLILTTICCYECGEIVDGIFCNCTLVESCGIGAHHGYNCPPKVLIISNPRPCNNQTIDEFPQTLISFDPTCYFGDGNSFTYDSTPNSVNDSPNIMEQMTSICDMVGQYKKKKEEDKRIAEEQAAKDRYWKIPFCYDDEESSIPLKDIIISRLPPCIAITPILQTEEPVDSLIMEDEHLDTILATESDEVRKYSVENLVQIPTHLRFSRILNVDSTLIDDDSFSIDDIDYVVA
ncbi:hypothetical protein Tco_1072462 [Tanacetum coccineum]